MVIHIKIALIAFVAPCMGAWVEITLVQIKRNLDHVAPCMGAWVEIAEGGIMEQMAGVAPCMGAWVEIGNIIVKCWNRSSHSTRGAWAV